MNYFVDAVITFKGDCDIEVVDKKIEEQLREEDCYIKDSYKIRKCEDKIEIELNEDFDFYDVETLVNAAISAGLKKFGRDKLIAYQTCADVHFKNYVTKDGKFLDFCGDCIY